MWESEEQVRNWLTFAVSKWSEHPHEAGSAQPDSLSQIPASLQYFSRRNGLAESFNSLANLILLEAGGLGGAQREPFVRIALIKAVLGNLDFDRITLPQANQKLTSQREALLERMYEIEKRLLSTESHSPHSPEFEEYVRELNNPGGLWFAFEQFLHSHPLMDWKPVKITQAAAFAQTGDGFKPGQGNPTRPASNGAKLAHEPQSPAPSKAPINSLPLADSMRPRQQQAPASPVYRADERKQLEGVFSQYLESDKAYDAYFRFFVPNAKEVFHDALRHYFFGGKAGSLPTFQGIKEMFNIKIEGVQQIISDISEILHSPLSPELHRLAGLHSAAAVSARELEAFRSRERQQELLSNFAARCKKEIRPAIIDLLEACSPARGCEIPPIRELEERFKLERKFITDMVSNAVEKGMLPEEAAWGWGEMEARRKAFGKIASGFPPMQRIAIRLLLEEALPFPKRCEVPLFAELAKKFGIERSLVFELMDTAHRMRDADEAGFTKIRIMLLAADKRDFEAYRERRSRVEAMVNRSPRPLASPQRPIVH